MKFLLLSLALLMMPNVYAKASKGSVRKVASQSGLAYHTPINMLCVRDKDSIRFLSADRKKVDTIDVSFRGERYVFNQIAGTWMDYGGDSNPEHNLYFASNAENQFLSVEYMKVEDPMGAVGPTATNFYIYLKDAGNKVIKVEVDDKNPTYYFECKKIKN
jgi:hypothetical protein